MPIFSVFQLRLSTPQTSYRLYCSYSCPQYYTLYNGDHVPGRHVHQEKKEESVITIAGWSFGVSFT